MKSITRDYQQAICSGIKPEYSATSLMVGSAKMDIRYILSFGFDKYSCNDFRKINAGGRLTYKHITDC